MNIDIHIYVADIQKHVRLDFRRRVHALGTENSVLKRWDPSPSESRCGGFGPNN